MIDDGRALENFPFSCANSSQKAKQDSAMKKVLRNTYSWREKFQRCGANKEFQRLTMRIHMDIKRS